jgi:hypothetical protein
MGLMRKPGSSPLQKAARVAKKGPAFRKRPSASKPPKKAGGKLQKKIGTSRSSWPSPDEPLIFLRENPKALGSQTRERYQDYRNAGTLTEALAMGAKMDDLKKDLQRGFLVRSEKMEKMDLAKCVRLFASDGDEPISFQQPNPKKLNTKSWKRYELYRNAVTIQECKRCGIWPGDIRNDLARGILRFGHSNQRAGPRSSKMWKVPRKSRIAALKKVKGAFRKATGGNIAKSKLSKSKHSSKQASESKDVTNQPFKLLWNKKHGWA